MLDKAYMDTLAEPKQKGCREKLELLFEAKDPKALRDPYEIESNEWINDLTVWPPVEFGDIYSYIPRGDSRTVHKKKNVGAKTVRNGQR